jgi:hypothetical protein
MAGWERARGLGLAMAGGGGVVTVLASAAVVISTSEELLDLLAPSADREFGILETAQNLAVLSLGVALLASVAWRRGRSRAVALALGLLCLFIVMEETDWLLHYADRFAGWATDPESFLGQRNLHNGALSALKDVFRTGALLVTMVVAFAGSFGRSPLGRTFRVSPVAARLSSVLLLSVALASIAYGGGPDDRQISSELEELALYASWGLLVLWPGTWDGSRDRTSGGDRTVDAPSTG